MMVLHEPVAAQLEARLPLGDEQFLHHVLRRDARVIGPRQPFGGPAPHALEADQHVLDDVVEGVAHVQHRREVGRRDHDHVRLAVRSRREQPALGPAVVQRGFDFLRTVLGSELERGLVSHSLL